MTILEFRQWEESAVPMWALVAFTTLALAGVLASARWLDNGGNE